MRRSLLFLVLRVSLAVCISLVLRENAAGETTTIAALLNEPAKFDGQSVTVVGTAGPYRRIQLQRGSPAVEFLGFRLTDERGAFVYVILQGGSTAGGRIEVTGVYRAEWKAIQPTQPFTIK